MYWQHYVGFYYMLGIYQNRFKRNKCDKKGRKILEYNFVIYPKSYNGTYINGYIKKDGYYELHIMKRKNPKHDYIVLFDEEEVEKVKEHFWCCTKTGREQSSIAVYTYCKGHNGHKKQYLKNMLYGKQIGKGEKLITENRNQLDFRRKNLLVDTRKGISRRKTSLRGVYGDNGIYPRKYEGNVIGYSFADNQKKSHYFGIRKYGTLEKCYEECKKYREAMM